MNKPNPAYRFPEIRDCFLDHPSRLEAFDLISKAFPTGTGVQSPILPRFIDTTITWENGGTFLANWNLTPREAKIALEVIEELKEPAGTLFLIPIPSQYGVPLEKQNEFGYRLRQCLEHIYEYQIMPPYFAIHTVSRSLQLVRKLQAIALSKLYEDLDLMAKLDKPLVAESKALMSSLFSKLGVSSK